MPTGIGVGIAGRVFKLTPGGGPVPVVSYNCSGGSCTDPGDGTGTYTTLAACQASCSAANPFIFTVKTDNTGTSNNDQFQLPLVSDGAISMEVAWGDGTSDTITAYNQADTLHTYAAAGSYTIEITNTVRGWRFRNAGDCQKMTDISQWGDFTFTLIMGWGVFKGCSNMTGTATDTPALTTNTLKQTFSGCTLWNGVMDSWDVSSVANLSQLFYLATAFNQPLNSWNVSSVTDMEYVFQSATSFDQPLNSWNTSAVTDMKYMFYNATSFDQPLNSWDVSDVTSMESTFSGASSFNQDIDSWNVSDVIIMQQMFYQATAFNQPLNSWNVSSVTHMNFMFTDDTSFNQPLDAWDTSSVTDMSKMFSGATSFNQPLCSWDISSLTPSSSAALLDFLKGSAFDRVNYNNLLISWGVTNLASTPVGLTPTFPSEYTNNTSVLAAGGLTGLTALLSPPWTITDGGGNASAFDNTYSTYFDASSSQYLLASATPLLGTAGTGAFTVSFWFKLDALTGSNQRLIQFGASGTQTMNIYINNSNGVAISGPFSDNYSAFTLSAGVWYSFIYRVDPSGGTAGFVMDGTNINNKSVTVPTFAADGTTYIGRNAGGGYLSGYMCDVAVWDKYLTDAECVELYNSGTPNNLQTTSMASDLDYWWRLGENGGPCIYPTQTNVSGTTNTLTMTNMASTNIQKEIP